LRLAIQQLLYALARKLQVTVRRLLSLLDEGMHNDNSPTHEEAVHRSANAGATVRTKLEESVAHAARVRKAQVRPVLDQEFDQPCVVRDYIDRPRLDLGQDSWVEVLDCVGHGSMLAHALTVRPVMPNV